MRNEVLSSSRKATDSSDGILVDREIVLSSGFDRDNGISKIHTVYKRITSPLLRLQNYKRK